MKSSLAGCFFTLSPAPPYFLIQTRFKAAQGTPRLCPPTFAPENSENGGEVSPFVDSGEYQKAGQVGASPEDVKMFVFVEVVK